MNFKVRQYKDTWYFSDGIFVERMQAVYYAKEKTLDIVCLKQLPKIVKYLQDNLDTDGIAIKWYNKETTKEQSNANANIRETE